jgi:hypothetical protein
MSADNPAPPPPKRGRNWQVRYALGLFEAVASMAERCVIIAAQSRAAQRSAAPSTPSRDHIGRPPIAVVSIGRLFSSRGTIVHQPCECGQRGGESTATVAARARVPGGAQVLDQAASAIKQNNNQIVQLTVIYL